ncbi:hypothetical protein [Streptomyces sp. NPDC046860]|uniref:hypothetical protein n=1 Tax=Streptomyces sp. NPDC046860 TaxID=3154495 RepID=UPI0033F82C6B
MSADEARGQSAAAEPEQDRTGPRHAAHRKPLMTRLHLPAGKAIAMAAMPTAVLMGMGFTPTLAVARDQPPNSKLADEYKDCVDALGGDQDDASATPSPSASDTGAAKDDGSASDAGKDGKASAGKAGGTSSSDSGSDGGKSPEPGASAPAPTSSAKPSDPAGSAPADGGSKEAGGGLLGTIGDTIGDVLNGGSKSASPSASPTPSASASATPSASGTPSASASAGQKREAAAGAAAKTADTPAPGTGQETEKAGQEPEESASKSATPSPSASASKDAEDCEKATDAVGGVDNKQLLPDDPWYLNASSLLLKGADYKGIVEVRTASGKTKKVLKYVISDGTEIGDLHQTVKDKATGKTYHVQAGKGTKSTITGGETVMYTESISGKLLGLIPLTFTPDSPPPLNLPEIYFTDVTVRQAGQFGGTLTIPRLHQYID